MGLGSGVNMIFFKTIRYVLVAELPKHPNVKFLHLFSQLLKSFELSNILCVTAIILTHNFISVN